jgi:hypothetical protein
MKLLNYETNRFEDDKKVKIKKNSKLQYAGILISIPC